MAERMSRHHHQWTPGLPWVASAASLSLSPADPNTPKLRRNRSRSLQSVPGRRKLPKARGEQLSKTSVGDLHTLFCHPPFYEY